MKNLGILSLVAILWFGIVLLLVPAPTISLAFKDAEDVKVRQLINDSGHLYLEVQPKEAAAKFSALTVAGMPTFPRDWLVANVASTVPLGESEIVDFPRFFDLLPKLFLIGRVGIAVLPLCVLLFVAALRYGVPVLKRKFGRRTFLVALFATSFLSLPEPIVDFAPGLDPSWCWFLNHFAFKNVFGSEVVFTYGPLGFLLCPQGSWLCVLCALAANVIFVFLWIRLLLVLYSMTDNGHKVAWLLIASTAIPVTMEWRWTLLAVLYAAIPFLVTNRDDTVTVPLSEWGIAGLLAACIGLMKFSSLTIVLGSQIFCLIALLFMRRGKALKPVLTYATVLVTSFAILSIICFSSLEAWVLWVRGSMATASGYNLYMVAEKTWLELSIPVVIGALCLYTIGWRHCLLFAPILFLTAKYAWVRQTSGPMAYAIALLAIACLLVRRHNIRRVVTVGMIALMLNVALVIPFALSGLSHIQSISGIKPLAFLHTLLLPRTVRLSLARSAESVLGSKLPSQWRARIGTGGVAFLPHEYAPAMADETLAVKPIPSLQLYSACHPYLDERNATFFRECIPDFVICEISAGTSGHFINYPRMWMALLENYECVEINGGLVLMARRENRLSSPEPLITVPSTISFGEMLQGTFFRKPLEYVTLIGGHGEEVRFPFVRGNQGVAFPLGWIPFDDGDIHAILSGGYGRVMIVSNKKGNQD